MSLLGLVFSHRFIIFSLDQVSNWFINAWVRLWKSMVEEMYKQENANAERKLSSSNEIASRTSGDVKASEDKHKQEGDLRQSLRSDYISDTQIEGTAGLTDYSYCSAESNRRGGKRFRETSESVYEIPRRFESSDGVSLTLGLQLCEGGSFPLSNISSDGLSPSASAMESEAGEFEQLTHLDLFWKF